MRGEFIDIGGCRLYYHAAGTRGAGDPMVFLHGIPSASHAWDGVIPLLPEGHRVVLVDLPGCGRSDPPHAGRAGIERQAAGILALMDALTIPRAVLVGHAAGALIARWIAVHHPGRVSRLALVSGWPAGTRMHALLRTVRTVARLGAWISPAVLAGFVHTAALRGFADPEEGRRSLDESLRPYTSPTSHDTLLTLLTAAAEPASGGTPAIPTAIVHGTRDPFIPVASAEQLARELPGASLHLIAGAHHYVPEDAPGQLAGILTALLAR